MSQGVHRELSFPLGAGDAVAQSASIPREVQHRRGTRSLAALFLLTLPLVNPWVRGDGVGYYAYIRSMVVEHRLDFASDWRNANLSFAMNRVRADGTIDPDQYTSTGHLDNHFSVGPAMLWAPFLVPVHLATLALEQLGFAMRPDGFSRPYVFAMALATALYGFLGLLLSFRLACTYVEEGWAFLATLGIWFASSLPVYMYFNPSWSHAHSVFVVGLFLWYWHRTRPARTLRQWVILGLISGLMLDVYYANVALLLFPLLESVGKYWTGWRARPHDASVLRPLFAGNVSYVSATLLAFLPTLITKKVIYGNPLETGYSGVIHWTSPSFTRVLFSSDHGLLTWTPILVPALFGLVLLYRLDPEFSVCSVAAFIAFCYTIACDSNWDGLSSFGNRFFTSLVPIFVVGLATTFIQCTKWLSDSCDVRRFRRTYIAASGLTGFLIAWNLGFIFQWGTHLIPVRGPISWRQMASNQFTTVPAELSRQVRAYFSRRGSLMQEIERKDVRQLNESP